jgi:hypothetical protein
MILEVLKKLQEPADKNRLVMILDGMGTAIVKSTLKPNGYFNRNLIGSEQAVIPATTVAATTAYRTGKMPFETGFIGWTQYFSESDEIIERFTNRNYYTGDVSKLPAHSNTLPCKTIVEGMNDAGLRAYEVMPAFAPGGCATFSDWLNRIAEICSTETNAYIYAYWTEPDAALHEFGAGHQRVKTLLENMESDIETAIGKIKNSTEILITADHGHINLEHFFLDKFADITECMERPISIEARCATFFIKPEYKDKFPDIFDKHFGRYFKLVTKEVFEKEYLKSNAPVRFVGDYVALATGHWGLCMNENVPHYAANHAGITQDELEIPIIKIETGK